MMGVSGLAGNPAYPPYAPPLPPISMGRLGQTLAKGFNALGWHWWPSDAAILSQDYRGRKKCRNAGVCDLGCAVGAKVSVDITYWPIAEQRGVKLLIRSRVREVTIDVNGMASGVLYHDETGAPHKQEASIVILSCNGVGTPRIMLNSTSRHFPEGIANRSGLVGKMSCSIHSPASSAGSTNPWRDSRGRWPAVFKARNSTRQTQNAISFGDTISMAAAIRRQ